MKKLLVLIASLAACFTVNAQLSYSTNVTAAGVYLLTTNRATVYSIEVSTTNACNLKFWDNDNLTHNPGSAAAGWWGTNFVNGAYTSKSVYLTNYANSYTNPIGVASWYTNSGLWTVTSTNAAGTNAVSPMVSIGTSGAETRVTYTSATFIRGIVFSTTGLATVTVYYKLEQ